MLKVAEVLIDLVSHALEQPFHYLIPESLQGRLKAGMKVKIPLGHRREEGYVLRLLKESPVEDLREITALVSDEPLLTAEQLAMASWLANRFYCRRLDAINAMVPAFFRQGKTLSGPPLFEAAEGVLPEDLSKTPAQKKAFALLTQKGPLTLKKLQAFKVTAVTVKNLEKRGLIRRFTPELQFDLKKPAASPTLPHQLSPEQAQAFKQVEEQLAANRPGRILLHGVTASGKTEIYLQAIGTCLKQGKTALVLVPEIALTPQMIERFAGRFPEEIAVLHSRLSPAEKNRHWFKIKKGVARVVLGARSAVFAPLENLGLIVIDEEHETTYKQEETPRYHARDVAWWRARYHRAVLVSGSATPSLESYHRALTGEDLLLKMPLRVTAAQLPPVSIVDMRQELKENNRQIFSRLLLKELEQVIEKDEQALLFINRRGFSGFVLCRECGYVIRCPFCDVSLTLHLDRKLMCCHYCGYETAVPLACPACGGIKIRHFSAGTQRVEEEVKKLFPGLPLLRMDSDTTTSREAHSRYYKDFKAGRAKILIGTQMIAKGFDFPDVTLVGVVAADTALNLPDFRAPERTFQLLTQVAGRTARGISGGRVIVQTYHPGHYSVQAASGHDYQAFYEAEIENRRQLAYPPFSDLIRLLFTGEEEGKVFAAASLFAAWLPQAAEGAEILGPAPAALYRVKNMYRVQTVIKGPALTRLAPKLKKLIRAYHEQRPPLNVRLAVDYNPLVVL